MGEHVVAGPFITSFGFRGWYWACRPSLLVAVPAGFWVTAQVAVLGSGTGGVIGGTVAGVGLTKGGKLVERLQTISDEQLAGMSGAVLYKPAELESIKCKRFVFGTNPDFVLTKVGGKRTKYGLGNPLAFVAVLASLQECYDDLVQGP